MESDICNCQFSYYCEGCDNNEQEFFLVDASNETTTKRRKDFVKLTIFAKLISSATLINQSRRRRGIREGGCYLITQIHPRTIDGGIEVTLRDSARDEASHLLSSLD